MIVSYYFGPNTFDKTIQYLMYFNIMRCAAVPFWILLCTLVYIISDYSLGYSDSPSWGSYESKNFFSIAIIYTIIERVWENMIKCCWFIFLWWCNTENYTGVTYIISLWRLYRGVFLTIVIKWNVFSQRRKRDREFEFRNELRYYKAMQFSTVKWF